MKVHTLVKEPPEFDAIRRKTRAFDLVPEDSHLSFGDILRFEMDGNPCEVETRTVSYILNDKQVVRDGYRIIGFV